jgi:hypothetical protein
VSKKPTIKIVKRDERSRAAAIADAPAIVIPTEQDSARTMTKTVNGWISEFKKKGPKAEKLFATVFDKPLRPNET